MANEEIKQKIKESNLKFWEVAYKYGITDGNFSRKLRKELPHAEKEKILNIIQELKNVKEV